jgi:hypothetical protein
MLIVHLSDIHFVKRKSGAALDLRRGRAHAAWSPSRAATRARGKMLSFVTSGIHNGSPDDQTRPGGPTPRRNVIARLAASNSGNRTVGGFQISLQRRTSAAPSIVQNVACSQPGDSQNGVQDLGRRLVDDGGRDEHPCRRVIGGERPFWRTVARVVRVKRHGRGSDELWTCQVLDTSNCGSHDRWPWLGKRHVDRAAASNAATSRKSRPLTTTPAPTGSLSATACRASSSAASCCAAPTTRCMSARWGAARISVR